jgi:MFS family permease
MAIGQANGGQQAVQGAKSSSKGIFKNRNFVLLWLGQGTSLIGDQFYLIALPWLVLQLTGDAVALGLVLALSGIPRAMFMLVGGALTDRFSQRSVMLASDAARFLLMVALAGLVLSGHTEMWILYAFAIVFSTFSGLFTPASTSIVPRLVGRDELQAGNTVVQGTAQLSVFVGPALAGGVIALFAGQGASTDMGGIGLAFAVDALTFLVSVATIWLMAIKGEPAGNKSDILGAIKEGIVYVLGQPSLRVFFLIIAITNLLFAGPFIVGVPVIASGRLPEGAAAFGLLMSAYGGGNLLGIILCGALPKPKPSMLGYIAMGVISIFGIGAAVFGFTTSTPQGCAVLAVLGICNGYIGILLITMLQKITPLSMMGRLMSLVLFSNVGLMPLSQLLTGFLITYSVEGLFLGVGVLFILLALAAIMLPEVRNVGSLI